MENVITTIFAVESEAYKAFSEMRSQPFGTGYTVAEASLVKRVGDSINVVDAFDAAGTSTDDTATGILVGSLVGILGGPLGVLIGAGVGALVGGAADSDDVADSASALEVTAAKLLEGDVAIIALVQESEPAFDHAFDGYETTIIRQFAVDVADEVDRARDLEAQLAREAKQQLRDERKAERKQKRLDRQESIKARFAEVKAERAGRKAEAKAERDERRAEARSAAEEAKAQYTSSTKEIMGEE